MMPSIKITDNCPITLDDGSKVRVTQDGYLVAAPRVARTGIQLYRGSEVGVSDKQIVKIYRPEDQVFDTTSMHTFAHKPITNDHPPEPVNSKNWSKYAKGQIGDEIARDGDFIRVPMVLMDDKTIQDTKNGKVELSVGYTCDLDMTPGMTPDGQAYDGIQKNINVNHVAFVDAARAGHMARFGDGSGECRLNASEYASAMNAAVCGKTIDGVFDTSSTHADSGFLGVSNKYPVMRDGCLNVAATQAAVTNSIANGDGDITVAARSLIAIVNKQPGSVTDASQNKETKMTKHVVDGITVEMEDTAIQVVDKAIKGLNSTIDTLKATSAPLVSDHAKAISDKDEQIKKLTADLTEATTKVATLEAQVKDSTMTPEKLEAMVRDRSQMVGKAKALHPSVVLDGKTDADIRRQVVDAKLGDTAKGWPDEQIKVSFDTLAAMVKDNDVTNVSGSGSNIGDVARSFSTPAPNGALTVDQAFDKRMERLQNAWKQ
jgi:hypothetical protein